MKKTEVTRSKKTVEQPHGVWLMGKKFFVSDEELEYLQTDHTDSKLTETGGKRLTEEMAAKELGLK